MTLLNSRETTEMKILLKITMKIILIQRIMVALRIVILAVRVTILKNKQTLSLRK